MTKIYEEGHYIYIRLRDLREDHDCTQKDIAKFLNCSQSSYSRIESGKQDIPTEFLKKLARRYNVSVDYLLEMEKE